MTNFPTIKTILAILVLLFYSLCSFARQDIAITASKAVQQNNNSTAIEQVDLTNKKGLLLYQNPFYSSADLTDWQMEGPGQLIFNQGWMQMFSPNQAMHHVLWCPENFPEDFIAEWQVQNLATEAGLAIVFFAAKGENGEDIFADNLPKRDGTFKQYTLGKINSYHISYYANAAHNPNRPHANLRKNNTFTLLQQGQQGIPTKSTAIHTVRLFKQGGHIVMNIDDRTVINYQDNAVVGDILDSGKIGLRQMQWSKMQYRHFKVWSLNNH